MLEQVARCIVSMVAQVTGVCVCEREREIGNANLESLSWIVSEFEMLVGGCDGML